MSDFVKKPPATCPCSVCERGDLSTLRFTGVWREDSSDMNRNEFPLVSNCSAARLAQKPCTEARQLNLRLETSHGELIIRTLAQWILRPKRTMVAKLSALKFGPSNHRTSTHQVVG